MSQIFYPEKKFLPCPIGQWVTKMVYMFVICYTTTSHQHHMLIYRATVTADNQVETYVGLTAGEFKKRHSKHKYDFKTEAQKTQQLYPHMCGN